MSELTLDDVLRWEGSALQPLALTDDTLARAVSWAVTIHASRPVLPPLRGGELVVLPTRILRELRSAEQVDIDALARRLTEDGVSAVLMEPDSAPLASARLPIITAETAYVAQAESRLNRKITERRSELYRLGSELARALSSASLGGAGIDVLLGVAEAITQHRILLLDPAGEVIGQSSPGVGLPVLEALESNSFAAQRISGRARDWLVQPLLVRETGQEFTVAIDLARHESAEAARLAVGQVAGAVAVLLDHAVRQAPRDPARERERFLREVFARRLRSAGAIEARARVFGLDLTGPRRVALVQAAEPAALEAFRAMLSPDLERSGVRLDDGDYAFVLPTAQNGRPRWRPDLRGRAREALLVVGPPANDAGELADSLSGAQAAARLAAGGLLTERVIWADDPSQLGLYGLLLRLQERDPQGDQLLAGYADHFLSALEQEDDRRHSALLESLAAYLDAGASLTDAAEQLEVHRNTLTYRLNRIRELLDDDLSDPRRRFQIQIAIAIRRVQRASAGA